MKRKPTCQGTHRCKQGPFPNTSAPVRSDRIPKALRRQAARLQARIKAAEPGKNRSSGHVHHRPGSNKK